VVKFREMSRGKFFAWALGGTVFLVGALTLAQQVGSGVSNVAKGVVSHIHVYSNNSASTASNSSEVADIKNASFDYLVPGSGTWKVDSSQTAYDPVKGIVKYQVDFSGENASATITQQPFPKQLEPRGGDKFMAFVNASKPARSEDVNGGTVYFLPALENGAPASGTDTVIFARDDVLMFGQAGRVLDWDIWTQMLATMKKH